MSSFEHYFKSLPIPAHYIVLPGGETHRDQHTMLGQVLFQYKTRCRTSLDIPEGDPSQVGANNSLNLPSRISTQTKMAQHRHVKPFKHVDGPKCCMTLHGASQETVFESSGISMILYEHMLHDAACSHELNFTFDFLRRPAPPPPRDVDISISMSQHVSSYPKGMSRYKMEKVVSKLKPVVFENPQEKLYKMEKVVSKLKPAIFENPQEKLYKMENVVSKL